MNGKRYAAFTSNAGGWPQDSNDVPSRWSVGMPTVSQANKGRVRQESFAYVQSFTIPTPIVNGQQFSATIPIQPDGDFWVDQIMMVGFGVELALSTAQTGLPLPGFIDIVDVVTGHSLTWPAATVPTAFFGSQTLFSDDVGFDAGASFYPDGWRATGILPEPYCFTRGGAILVTITSLATFNVAGQFTDIAFHGWKEYQFAS